MGRSNQRGLELSFKPVQGSRGRGRWYKKIRGCAAYFGWGDGVSDRASYQLALAAYRQHQAAETRLSQATVRTARSRQLQHMLSSVDHLPQAVNLNSVRSLIADLSQIGGHTDAYAQAADAEERRRILEELTQQLGGSTLEELRVQVQPLPAKRPSTKTLSSLLDEFVAAQRLRMERREKLDALCAEGQKVREASRENLSPGRFAEITYNVASFKECCGQETWDGTEATAARIVGKFRAFSESKMLASELKPRTFNKWIVLARQFCGWCESTYRLDRLPRDKSLFAKYEVGGSQAKAIPLPVLKKLWKEADDRGRCFILLALNCAYYAVDISDLRAEQVEKTHLSHRRGKSGARVRYLLWAKTRELLKKVGTRTGRVFTTRDGTPLVHYSKLSKSGSPMRIDNVRNWWVRLCAKLTVAGYSFSNIRDTASTAVESIDRSLTDLFLAHKDDRMAAFYVDGEMVDTTALDRLISQLETQFSVLWTKARKTKGMARPARLKQIFT